MNFFEGHFETVHLERGQSFGIPPKIYQCLAQAAISASELASIEPQVVEPLQDGRPGLICLLYGAQHMYTIQIEIKPPPPVVGLGISLLDDPAPAQPIQGGDARTYSVWRKLVGRMLANEGFQGMTLAQIQEWNAEHGFA